MEYTTTYQGNEYLVTTEPPKNGDQVLTDNYGVCGHFNKHHAQFHIGAIQMHVKK